MPEIHVWLHATEDAWNESDHPRADNGEFGTGGKKHDAVASHTHNPAKAEADKKERHDDLTQKRGFKHEPEKSDEGPSGKVEHYGHANGSRATVTHHVSPITGQHAVSSYINSQNAGKGVAKTKMKEADIKKMEADYMTALKNRKYAEAKTIAHELAKHRPDDETETAG